jgi:DNA-binding CsgD family transcriptional regulator
MPSAPEAHISLTQSEAATLRAIADHNMTNPQLAEHFGVSEPAINSRLHRLYERTGLAGRVEAAVWAVQHRECCVARAIS